MTEVKDRLRRQKVVSIIQYSHSLPRWFFVTRASHLPSSHPSGMAVYEIFINTIPGEEMVVGETYQAWKVNEEPWCVDQLSKNMPLKDNVTRVTFGLLLPLLGTGEKSVKHCLITKSRENV